MKKAITILVLICYTIASFGATVHVHYCMNKVISCTWCYKPSEKCDYCGMAKKKSEGCCRDEQCHIQLHGDQQAIAGHIITPVAAVAIIRHYLPLAVAIGKCLDGRAIAWHGPPLDIRKRKLYLQNSMLLI